MSDLQLALLVVGLVAFIVVLVATFDKKQLSRIRRHESRMRTEDAQWKEPNLVSQEERYQKDEIADSDDRELERLMQKRESMRHQSKIVFESGNDEIESEADQRDTSPNDDQPNQEETLSTTFDNLMVEPATTKKVHDNPDVDIVIKPEQLTSQVEFTGFSDSNIEIDFVAYLAGKNSINRNTALGLFRQYELDIDKPVRVFGLNTALQEWTDLTKDSDNAQYHDIGMSIQLADQNGPISESILNKFSQMILRFADVFGRRFRFSMEFDDALKRAMELDQFSRQYDSLAVVNIVARNNPGFSGRGLDYNARELGLETTSRGIYVAKNKTGIGAAELYSMANLTEEGTFNLDNKSDQHSKGVTIFMSIPSTHNPTSVFNDVVLLAKELAKRLDGKLVDQSQRGMTQKGIKAISKQIRQIEYDMDRAGVKTGSDIAVRLFHH